MNQDYEVVIIGGGIHGTGVAQASAAAGYRTLILEKSDWAAGTSSKSSKLIHGGLRYLQSGELSLVWECLRERELLIRNAPELVHRQGFYIPVYQNSTYKSWQIRLGLTLYALLAGASNACRFHCLPKDQWRQLNLLNTVGLRQVYVYQDAQTDDRLLTQAVVRSAQNLGAEALCRTEFIDAEKNSQGYTLRIRQKDSDEPRQIKCRVLINAGGPWVNQVNARITPAPPALSLDLVQGAHIVIQGELAHYCFYLESPLDHRAVFAMPWYGNTLVGTTETLFQGDPNKVTPLPEEEAYLLRIIEHYFPNLSLEVLERFAGLRVLPKSERGLFYRSRETQLVCDSPKQPSCISIYGGKLTSYRATAEKVVKLIRKNLSVRDALVNTREIRLTRA